MLRINKHIHLDVNDVSKDEYEKIYQYNIDDVILTYNTISRIIGKDIVSYSQC